LAVKTLHTNENPHILVIRLSAMGDVAMTVPVLMALTAQYPLVKVTVLSKAFLKPVFEGIPNVSFYEAEVKTRHKGLKGLYTLSKELQGLNITAVADLHNVLRSNILKFFLKLQGHKVVQINKGRNEKKALTRLKNKTLKPLKTTHQRYADVFEKLGFSLKLNAFHVLPKRSLTPALNKKIGAGTKKWIGIAPFAAFKGKMYPLAIMEQVIAALNDTEAYKILLFGGGKEETAILNNLASKYSSVISMAGVVSFSEELSVISNLDIMLAMDSGNAHLSAMFGVATLTLWGVTHPYAGFYPFAQPEAHMLLADRKKYPLIPTSVYGNKCPDGYENAMNTISPEEVVQLIESKLK
jgi:ADP-heptose:LPS heptosyltransferase